jgi:hypothetical protein
MAAMLKGLLSRRYFILILIPLCGALVVAALLIYNGPLSAVLKEKRAKADVQTIEKFVLLYKQRLSAWPPTLEVLTKWELDTPLLLLPPEMLVDPWGRPYHYDSAMVDPVRNVPLIWSEGPKPEDPTSKIANW